MTVEAYLRTPVTVRPKHSGYGAVHLVEAPLPPHQRAVGRLFRALDDYVTVAGIGEVWLSPIDVILNSARHLIVQPDLLFISRERDHIVVDRIRGAPDLIVEVLSPHPRVGQLHERLMWFGEYDVRECWVVDPIERRVDVLTFADGRIGQRRLFDARTPIVSSTLPGFSRTLDSILAGPGS
jgi:Uma2 family endonuclease